MPARDAPRACLRQTSGVRGIFLGTRFYREMHPYGVHFKTAHLKNNILKPNILKSTSAHKYASSLSRCKPPIFASVAGCNLIAPTEKMPPLY
jgi:hypothetical protein